MALGGNGCLVHKAETLWAFVACNRDSFTFVCMYVCMYEGVSK
jgi:hypothetical protein